MSDQAQTDPRDDDRKMVALGQKMGLIFADGIRETITTQNWDNRERQCFWNGIMAELTGAACSHLGFNAAKDMFDYIAVQVVPQLQKKSLGVPEPEKKVVLQ